MKEVIKYLESINVKYDIVNHPAVFSTLEADKYIKGMDGIPSKSMFMAGRKDRNFYLFIMNENKRLNIKKLNDIIGDKLHFGRENDLKKKMNLFPGAVSLFGLLNNDEHDINVYIDRDILSERLITFHPNDNKATIFISVDDMFKILDDLCYEYNLIDL